MIRNVVFDIGNVVTRWDPQLICSRTFGEDRATLEFSGGLSGMTTGGALTLANSPKRKPNKRFTKATAIPMKN